MQDLVSLTRLPRPSHEINLDVFVQFLASNYKPNYNLEFTYL